MTHKSHQSTLRLILILFAMGIYFLANAKQGSKPNIIFYLADDQDIYDYGCYGNDKINTPAVNQLAREGMLFENAYTGQSICAPSRSQLYTGNYPLKNGCFINHFCMFITSYYPHGEYFDVPAKPADNIQFYPFNKNKKRDPAALKRMSGYYRSVEEDNIHLAQVLKYVDEELDDNNLFIYSADHGVSGKFTVYDRGLNVPFVARWPKVIKAGTRSDALIHYTDVVPTFIEMAGGKAFQDLDGKSFLPILKDESAEIHDYVYGVQTNQGILAASVFPVRSIRSKQYHYICNFNAVDVIDQNFGNNSYVNAFLSIGANKYKHIPFEELYEIEKDPFEQNNLAQDASYNLIKQKMALDLKQWMKEQGDILTGEPGYMPLIWTKKFLLDQSRSTLIVPDSLENTLRKEDYLILDY